MNNTEQKEFFQQCLYDALLGLMERKPLESINVGELCDAAGVSRMTYYRSYDRMEDILVQHLDSCFEEFVQDVDKARDDLERIVLLFFRYIGETEARFFRCLANSSAVHLLSDRFDSYIAQLVSLVLPEKNLSPYAFSYMAGGSYRIIVDWLRNGQDESCEAMAQVILSLLNCLTYFDKSR